jgi:hypothetical protein
MFMRSLFLFCVKTVETEVQWKMIDSFPFPVFPLLYFIFLVMYKFSWDVILINYFVLCMWNKIRNHFWIKKQTFSRSVRRYCLLAKKITKKKSYKKILESSGIRTQACRATAHVKNKPFLEWPIYMRSWQKSSTYSHLTYMG